jgi:hypothetical protein
VGFLAGHFNSKHSPSDCILNNCETLIESFRHIEAVGNDDSGKNNKKNFVDWQVSRCRGIMNEIYKYMSTLYIYKYIYIYTYIYNLLRSYVMFVVDHIEEKVLSSDV